LVSNTSLATNNLSEDFQEQIIFHSRGLITSYIPLYTINKNYIWTVGIKAEIENNVMQETVTGIIQNATKPRNSAVIDAASKWAEQKAYEQSQQEAQKQTQEMFKRSAVDLTNLFVKEFDMSNMLTVISHQEVFDSST
jgi:hypothetical protein